MGILNKETKTQAFFRDDNKFQLVKRNLEFSCLVEKAGDTMKRGWKHFYNNQFYFGGYKNMSADSVTLGFSRDIILDPFNKIAIGDSVGTKPKINDKPGLKKWIAMIAENQRHTYRSKPKISKTNDIINLALVGVLGLMIAVWAITFLVKVL